jgi:AbrB family transcriptional regulator (stage V sporulation protein T)
MKATGIVRRIDELGRVVIPKEIRRTLRIKEGDPLEIFTDRDELMLKKYSPIATLDKMSEATAKTLHDLSGHTVLICDSDEILAVCGEGRRIVGRHLSREVDKVLKERRSYLADRGEGGNVYPITEEDEGNYQSELIVPIVSEGDCLGAVVLLSVQEGVKIENAAIKLACLTSEMLANQFN